MNYKFILKYFSDNSMRTFEEDIVSKYPINQSYDNDTRTQIFKEILSLSSKEINLYLNKVFELYQNNQDMLFKQMYIDIQSMMFIDEIKPLEDLNAFAEDVLIDDEHIISAITPEDIDKNLLDALCHRIIDKAIDYKYFERKNGTIIIS